MLKEFKEFAMRGNVVDMAVGIIIGASFGTIVKSLVDDVIMPPVGILLGGVDFSDIAITLRQATIESEAVTMNIGVFINAVISFMIVAFAVFLLVKGMNAMQRKQEEAPEEAPPPPQDVQLLQEIRDLLKKQNA
jgi:large conductance mechanosensitive channel